MANVYISDFEGRIVVLGGYHAREQLRADLSRVSSVVCLLFTVEFQYWAEVFGRLCDKSEVLLLADARAKDTLRSIKQVWPQVQARCWPANRYHHTKAIILPEVGVSWIGSHNMTRSSWFLGHNLMTRIESELITARLNDYAQATYNAAPPLR